MLEKNYENAKNNKGVPSHWWLCLFDRKKDTLVRTLNFASTSCEDFHIYIDRLARFSRHEITQIIFLY